jgi:hypothetical protein
LTFCGWLQNEVRVGESNPAEKRFSGERTFNMKGSPMKLLLGLTALVVAAPALSQNSMAADPGAQAIQQPATTPSTQAMDQNPTASPPAAQGYPVCTAKVTDKCVEQRAIAKAPVHKAASSKVVRKDKVHRRKG